MNFGSVHVLQRVEVVAIDRRRDGEQQRHARILGAGRHGDPRSERHPGRPDREIREAIADEVDRRLEVLFLAGARIERSGAAADAPEIEAQRGDADARHRLGRLIQRLRVHGAAMQRMRMAEHRDGTRLALGHVEQRFERAGRARNLTQKVWRHS